MRVILDALGLPKYGGARSSAVGWIAALARYGPAHDYHVFVSQPEPELESFANLKLHLAPIHNRFLVRLWAQAAIPAFARSVRADLYHATKNLSLLGLPCPTLITVNDMTHLVLADRYPWLDNFFWRRVQPRLLKKARRVIAISHSTAQGLRDAYGLGAEQVCVIYPACHARYRQPSTPQQQAAVRARHGLPPQYVLYVGGLGVHKNVGALVSAFRRIAGDAPHDLVLVGANYHTSSDVRLLQEIRESGGRQRIHLLNHVPEDDMPAIYQLADLFVLPSLNEGFGLVLLEAMSSGAPVIATRAGAIPEVVAEAGCLLEDPHDIAALAQVMGDLLTQPQARQRLRELGYARAAQFTWEAAATQTLALYHAVLAATPTARRPA